MGEWIPGGPGGWPGRTSAHPPSTTGTPTGAPTVPLETTGASPGTTQGTTVITARTTATTTLQQQRLEGCTRPTAGAIRILLIESGRRRGTTRGIGMVATEGLCQPG